MSDLGVDRVRITASWRQLAPERDSRRKPAFDAADPAAYDRAALARLDTAVDGARARGMKVMLDLGFFAPRWAVQRPAGHGRNVWRPSVREYRLYARAMARHYDGRVRLWTTWNEPNHGVFLRPAVGALGQRLEDRSTPHLYRRLHDAAYDQVKAQSKPQPRAHRRPVVVRDPGPRARTTWLARCASRASWPAWMPRCARCARPSAAASGRCARTASRSTRTRWTRRPRPPTPMPTGSRSASWPS